MAGPSDATTPTCAWCGAAASAADTHCPSCGAALTQRDPMGDLGIPGVTQVDPALAAHANGALQVAGWSASHSADPSPPSLQGAGPPNEALLEMLKQLKQQERAAGLSSSGDLPGPPADKQA